MWKRAGYLSLFYWGSLAGWLVLLPAMNFLFDAFGALTDMSSSDPTPMPAHGVTAQDMLGNLEDHPLYSLAYAFLAWLFMLLLAFAAGSRRTDSARRTK